MLPENLKDKVDMIKRILLPAMVTLVFAGLAQQGFSQNFFTQSFDGATFPPTGWSNSNFTPPSSACCAPNFKWQRITAYSGTPAAPTHSGAGMAWYNSHNIGVDGAAELASPAADLSVYSTGYNQVSFWMYRNYNYGAYTDSLCVYANTSPSAGGTKLATIHRDTYLSPTVGADGWYQYTYTIPSTYTGNTYIVFKAFSDSGYDIHLDDISLDHIPPCYGYPTFSGTSPSGTVSYCPGSIQTFTGIIPPASGYKFQWQRSTDGGTTWHNMLNDTNLSVSILVSENAQYKIQSKCTISTARDSSAPFTINVTPAVVFDTLPYSQDFETWNSRCGTSDIPDSSWTIYPASGSNAWRRDDQGGTASWAGTGGSYSPASSSGSHSARFHSSALNRYDAGEMDLYLDCSKDTSGGGGKQVDFDYYNYNGTDSLDVYLSVDSGITFTHLQKLLSAPVWTRNFIPFVSNSGKTIIKFVAASDNGSSDIGLDNLVVSNPCNGKPSAGSVVHVSPCSGVDFLLALSGSTESAEMYYVWQQSPDSIRWYNLPDTTATVTANITTSTYFRAIVTCRRSGLTDTSAGVYFDLMPFYKCYCNPAPASFIANPLGNIGNVTIMNAAGTATLLNNGNPYPILNNPTANKVYANYDTLPVMPLVYIDSVYKFSITENSNSSIFTGKYPAVVYIDYDHNGMFDSYEIASARFMGSSAASPTVTDSIHISTGALGGITGMRVVLGIYDSLSSVNPCGYDPNYGEYEDYLININYDPCNGPLNAGTVLCSATSLCIGYPFSLTDTTHDYNVSGFSWNWQQSGDSILWYDMAGTTNRDTMSMLFSGEVFYRLKIVCSGSHDTSFSKFVHITRKPAYACYCYSAAKGDYYDSSDIGGMSFATFTMSKGGTHLNNSKAIDSHLDFTDNVIDLDVDSVYPLQLFYILKRPNDGWAKITLFMDVDNSLTYDAPREEIWKGVTGPLAYYVNTNITIPGSVLSEVKTGMRLVLNNDTFPNVPSDHACGTYVSGETMDFTVRFHYIWRVGTATINNVNNVRLYPNPSGGITTLAFETQDNVKQLEISVTNMTGQVLYRKELVNTTGNFSTDIDLTGQTPGIYFVTINADGQRMIRKLVLN